MEFAIGDKVVYPNHGLGYIEVISNQKIAGQNIQFYQLRLVETNSTILIPVNNVQSVGLRKTINKKDIKVLIHQLQEDCPESHIDWKHRFRQNTDKMKTGKISDVVDVLKILAKVNSNKSLSFREKKMFDRAKRLLISEIAAVEDVAEDMIEHRVDEALLKSVGPHLPGNA